MLKSRFKTRKSRFLAGFGAVVLGAILFSACGGGTGNNAINTEQKTSTAILRQLEIAQPIPQFQWSQYRQTLIDIETAEANGTQTTSFFFNMGVPAPIQSCPSIGFPVASTSELTNPQQIVNDPYPNGGASVPIPQIDPNGIYAGNSTGTYVICVAPNGSTYAQYWEGFVDTVSGPAVWDTSTNSIRMTGPSSAKFKVGR